MLSDPGSAEASTVTSASPQIILAESATERAKAAEGVSSRCISVSSRR